MKRLTILIVLVSLIAAVVSNADDFTLLKYGADSVQDFSDFFTWIEVGALCTGAGFALGLAVTYENPDYITPLVLGSVGLGTGLTISLVSSSGDSIGEVIFGHIFPVLIGAAAFIIVAPVMVMVGLLYLWVEIIT
jgi:hypothetical protein